MQHGIFTRFTVNCQGKRVCGSCFRTKKKIPGQPALVVELKWDKTAEGALAQIKDKEYCRSLEEYQGKLASGRN